MVVITADRPSSLRESGAPQTINQIDIYGHYAITTRELPLPVGNDSAITWRDGGLRALSMISPLDPVVHFNAPFDEPLIPTPEAAAQIVADECSITDVSKATIPIRELPASDKWDLQQYGRQLAESKRPIIICGAVNGPLSSMKRILDLARRYGAPVIADCASQLRRHPGVVCHGDLILRDPLVGDRLAPDLILRIGGLPTSRALNEWIASTPAKEKIAISARRPADPDRCLTHHLWTHLPTAIDVLTASDDIEENSQWEYRDLWISCDRVAGEVIQRMSLSSGGPFEPEVVADVCRLMRENMSLFLSNSMPIRWAEMYADSHVEFPQVFVNRGANGIDGIISTSAGIARTSEKATVCVLGDLTFLHDPSGLWRLKIENVPLKLVVLNNDGGGVFHFLPISAHSGHFETLVAMPHGVDLSHLAAAHGISHHMAGSRDQFQDLFRGCLTRTGPEVIEVRMNRASNFKRHQEIVDHVARATRTALGLA